MINKYIAIEYEMNVKVFCFLAEESVFDMMVYKSFHFLIVKSCL
jgi:hypothetical protein